MVTGIFLSVPLGFAIGAAMREAAFPIWLMALVAGASGGALNLICQWLGLP